jgi:hypothetical protein
MEAVRGKFVSGFPPGYSILLAAGGLVRSEFWVTPMVGALSGKLLHDVLAREGSRPVALALSLLWFCCPLVIQHAVDMMSDLPAAVALIASYALLTTGRIRAGALVLGLSSMIRPTNMLFVAGAVLLLQKDHRSLSTFLGWCGLGVLCCLAAHVFVWGEPLSPLYRKHLHVVTLKTFRTQFGSYALETAKHLGPILLPAFFEAFRAPRKAAPEMAWIAAFFLTYSLAGPFTIDWATTRFLLPCFPAFFVLTARGIERLRSHVQHSSAGLRFAVGSAAFMTVASWAGFSLARSGDVMALQIRPRTNPVCDELEAILPKNALVGALEFTAPLRGYSGFETFTWAHPEAPAFVRSELSTGRPVFLLVPHGQLETKETDPGIGRFAIHFELERKKDLSWDYRIYQFRSVREPADRFLISLGDPIFAWVLHDGWLSPRHPAVEFREVQCEEASLSVWFARNATNRLEVIAAAPTRSVSVAMEVWLGDRLLGRTALDVDFTKSAYEVPVSMTRISLAGLRLRFPGAPRCLPENTAPVAFVKSLETYVPR